MNDILFCMFGEYFKMFLHHTITLITIVNPIAAASIMLSLLPPNDDKIVKSTAKKATLIVLTASFITLLLGEMIFKLFGISVLSIEVIGGIIIMLISINMVYGEHSKARHSPEEREEAKEKEDIAIVPLGIPILFGPGVIAVLILLNNQLNGLYSYIVTSLSILTAGLAVYLTLLYAAKINKLLGVTGIKILTRIMGLILGAIASQMLINGIKGLWNG